MIIKKIKPKKFPENADISCLNTIKFGIDPTFNRLHIGHLVPLSWLKKKKGDIHIILGINTAQLGDPSGQNKTRPILDKELVLQNALEIKKQIEIILPNALIKFQIMPSTELLLKTASNFTLNKVLSRHEFSKRESISLHELLVPILQALDSVSIESELELGGEDQLFNFELTREVQKIFKQKPEACLMFPIINGKDGNKMSKSKKNCIWIDDPQIENKIMSLPDNIMDEWLPLFFEGNAPEHPKERKELLIKTIKELKNKIDDKENRL